MERIRQVQRGKSFIHLTVIHSTRFPEPRYAMRQARCGDGNRAVPLSGPERRVWRERPVPQRKQALEGGVHRPGLHSLGGHSRVQR